MKKMFIRDITVKNTQNLLTFFKK